MFRQLFQQYMSLDSHVFTRIEVKIAVCSTGLRFRQLPVKEDRSLYSCEFNRIEV